MSSAVRVPNHHYLHYHYHHVHSVTHFEIGSTETANGLVWTFGVGVAAAVVVVQDWLGSCAHGVTACFVTTAAGSLGVAA